MIMQLDPIGGIQPKFPLGKVVITQGVRQTIPSHQIPGALKRHALGDWGELEEQDRISNEQALKEGGRLVSVYKSEQRRFYIITEADRSYTTILLPSEY